MKNWMLVTLISASLIVSAGCARKDSHGGSQPSDGTSSGGGGFGDENSMRLLGWGKKVVADSLRRTNPQSLQGLPPGWNPERLAKLIENTKTEPNKVVYRYGRELMFDYKVPKNGEPYLIATSLFFRSHAAIPVNSLWETQREPYIREIRTKLLHEAAHVLGIGLTEKTDHKARGFAQHLIINIFAKNNILCSTPQMPENYPGVVDDDSIESQIRLDYADEFKYYGEEEKQNQLALKIEEAKRRPYYWIINRATAFGVQVRRQIVSPKLGMKLEDMPWMEKLMAGKPEANYMSVIHWSKRMSTGNMHVEFSDPKREYMPTFVVGESRIQQQYYKEVKIEAGSISYKGEMESPEGDRICRIGDKLILPVSKEGKFEGKLNYFDNCPDIWFSARSKEPVDAEIKLSCVESVPRLGDLNQFYNEGPYTDQSLNDFEKYKDDLD